MITIPKDQPYFIPRAKPNPPLLRYPPSLLFIGSRESETAAIRPRFICSHN